MGCAVGISFECDCGDGDDGGFGKFFFEVVVFWLARGEAKTPAIVVDDDGDVVRVVEGLSGAIVGGIVKVPLRRCGLPDEFVEVVGVLGVAEFAAVGGEIILIPPGELGFWRQGGFVGGGAADEISADGDDCFAALGPEGGDDVGGAGSPVETCDEGFWDIEGVHEGDDVESYDRLLAVAESVAGEEGCGAVAAQVRYDDAVTFGG